MPGGYIGSDGYDERGYQRVRVAVLRVTGTLPPFARAGARKRMLDAMEREFKESGVPVPPWMPRLREDIGW